MKIDDSSKKTPGISINTAQPRSAKAAEKAEVGMTSSDSVTLSSTGQALAANVSVGGVFDTNKVEQIKAAIASGQFQVNAERVAEGLIDSVKELISTRKG